MGRAGKKLLRRAVVAGALGVAAIVALAGTAQPTEPTTVQMPNLEFTPNGGVTPRVLPKSSLAPVALTIDAKFDSVDGTHPPALRELAIELDRNIAVDLSGYPACHLSRIQTDPPQTPEELCRGSIIGAGTMTLEIKLAESAPIPVRSRVRIINGVRKGDSQTLYLATYITVPTPTSIVAQVQIEKVDDGRYGSEAIIAIPKIAGGSGSITSLNLRIKRRLHLDGKRFSPVTAKCPNGKLQILGAGTFFDYETGETTKATGEMLRTCIGR